MPGGSVRHSGEGVPPSRRLPGTPLHDPCAIAWLARPDLFTTRDCSVRVDLGPGIGLARRTVIDRWNRLRRPPQRCRDGDGDRRRVLRVAGGAAGVAAVSSARSGVARYGFLISRLRCSDAGDEVVHFAGQLLGLPGHTSDDAISTCLAASQASLAARLAPLMPTAVISMRRVGSLLNVTGDLRRR